MTHDEIRQAVSNELWRRFLPIRIAAACATLPSGATALLAEGVAARVTDEVFQRSRAQRAGGRILHASDVRGWKSLAGAGVGASGSRALVRKHFVADSVKAEGASRSATFVISTGTVDRDRDSIAPDGWHLDAYRRNPVVLWAHDYSGLPIGRAESIQASGGKLTAVVTFADHPFADTVLRLIRTGFVRAASVGFRPLRHAYNEERRGYGGPGVRAPRRALG